MADMNAVLNFRKIYNVYKLIPCSHDENKEYAKYLKQGTPLPANIEKFQDPNDPNKYTFATKEYNDIEQQSIMEFLKYQELELLKTIKNCQLFFVTLICGSLGLTAMAMFITIFIVLYCLLLSILNQF